MNKAKESVSKLLNFDIETVLCYNDGEYNGDISERLKKIRCIKGVNI